MSTVTLITKDENKFSASRKIESGDTISKVLYDALIIAVKLEDALEGKDFKIDMSLDHADSHYLANLTVAPESLVISRDSASSSSSAPVAKVIAWGVSKLKAGADGEIDADVLKEIRSFKPKEEDMKFVFTAYEPTQSSVLSHRQRVMALLRLQYTTAQIREMIENKKTKLVADADVRAMVLGIPKKRLELVLSDSVLTGVMTNYAMLLRSLFQSNCVVSDDMMGLVPDYIGVGGKSEKVKPTPEETVRRRRAFLNATANYLRPLYTNKEYRDMITNAGVVSLG